MSTSKTTTKSPDIQIVEDFIKDHWQIRYNEISVEFEYKDRISSDPWEKLNENVIYRQLQHSHIKYSISNLVSLLRSDFVEKYNPFRDYFENLHDWDGGDHIRELTKYLSIGEDQKERLYNMLRKWLVRSIACCFGETFNKQAIVIIGSQNNGKSSLLRWICPKPLFHYYKEDIGTDKDSMIAIAQNFIVNIDELSTLQRKDLDSIKSLMSKENVNVRIPYDRTTSHLTRRCNFVASTDKAEFLTDEAGSVRWICFAINEIHWDYSRKISVDDIWSQAFHFYKLGKSKFNYQLTRDEIKENEDYNLQFYMKSDEHEAILHCFDRADEAEHDAVITASEAIEIIKMNRNFANNRLNSTTVGKALKFLQFVRCQRYESELKYNIKGYYVKYKPGLNIPNQTNDENKETLPF